MRIEDIDLAAAITTRTGLQPELSNYQLGQLQTFTFPDVPEVITAVTLFATGDLSLPAKRLLTCRSALYRQIKASRQRIATPKLHGVDQDSKTAVVALAGEVPR